MKGISMNLRKSIVAISLTGAACLLASTSANAAYGTVVCSGTVTSVSITANNVVMVRLSNMNDTVMVCNLESNWDVTGVANGYVTGPNTCKALYMTFVAAKVTGSELQNVYFDSANAPASCSTWSSWQTANIRYVTL